MGYLAHHAVIVHISGYTMQPGASIPCPDIDAFRASLPEEWQPLVVGPIQSVVNHDYTAVFLSDGSKEGWGTSDDGDYYRARFADLFSARFDDGSGPFDVAVIRFGGDEPGQAWIRQPYAQIEQP